jgi:hypothetical protein
MRNRPSLQYSGWSSAKELPPNRHARFVVNCLRHFLISLAALACVLCFTLSLMAKPTGCRWSDLNRTTIRSQGYLAMVRQQDCWDHQNYSIRIELPNKWFIDLDLENETDNNEDEPSIKWTAPLTLEVVVHTATIKGTIERQINDYDSPNHSKITVIRQYIPR